MAALPVMYPCCQKTGLGAPFKPAVCGGGAWLKHSCLDYCSPRQWGGLSGSAAACSSASRPSFWTLLASQGPFLGRVRERSAVERTAHVSVPQNLQCSLHSLSIRRLIQQGESPSPTAPPTSYNSCCASLGQTRMLGHPMHHDVARLAKTGWPEESPAAGAGLPRVRRARAGRRPCRGAPARPPGAARGSRGPGVTSGT